MHLVDLSENRARFRTGVVLPPQAGLTFKWMGPSRDTLVVHGHVSETRMIDKRTAEYDIDFTMTGGVRDRLGFELNEVYRRRRDKIMNATAEMMGDFAFERVADRKGYRTVVQFPVTVQAKKNAQTWIPLRGEARDLSIGGMMLALPEEFEKGTELELAFHLPFDHEMHDADNKVIVEVTPFGERRRSKSAPVRPFEQIQTRARIIKVLGNARNGSPLYGVRFVGLSGLLEDEVARWIHAHQLIQLRKSKEPKKHRKVPRAATPARESSLTAKHREYTVAARTISLRQAVGEVFAAAALPKVEHERHRERVQERTSLRLPVQAPRLAPASEDIFGFSKPMPVAVAAPSSPGEPFELTPVAPVVDELDVFGLGKASA